MKYIFIFFSIISSNALACSCMGGYTIDEAFEDYPIVFVGTVQSIDVNAPMKITFQTDFSYKGMISKEVLVYTKVHAGECGFRFEENSKYAVFAYPSVHGLKVSRCSPTVHFESDKKFSDRDGLSVVAFLTEKAHWQRRKLR